MKNWDNHGDEADDQRERRSSQSWRRDNGGDRSRLIAVGEEDKSVLAEGQRGEQVEDECSRPPRSASSFSGVVGSLGLKLRFMRRIVQ